MRGINRLGEMQGDQLLQVAGEGLDWTLIQVRDGSDFT